MSQQINQLPLSLRQERNFPERIENQDLQKCSGHTVALDTETNGLKWWENHFIGIGAYCPQAGVTGYLPAYNKSDRKEISRIIQNFHPQTNVIFHNAKFDLHFLGIAPATVPWGIIDTTILVHLYDSRLAKNLHAAAKYFLGDSSKNTFRNQAPTKIKNRIWQWPVEAIAEYCVNDCRLTYLLAKKLVPEIHELDLWKLFKKEIAYLKVIWEIERRGVLFDRDFLEHGIEKFETELLFPEQELFSTIGYEFNWRSHQQLSKAIYDDLQIEKPRAGFANTDSSTMTSARVLQLSKHPLAGLILYLREIDDLLKKTTCYCEHLDNNNVIHTSYNLSGSRGGRLASRNPNLQNIPSPIRIKPLSELYSKNPQFRRDEYNLRNAIIPRPGYKLMCIDWKQMEMRMFAIIAQDPRMLEMIESGEDVHSAAAETIWGSSENPYRYWAKQMGFALIYGMQPRALQTLLDVSSERAKKIVVDYHRTFPRIKPFLHETQLRCQAKKYIRNWYNRFWRENNSRFMYKGANYLIQSGCAEVLSIAVIRCFNAMLKFNQNVHMIGLVHDEILFEIPREQENIWGKFYAQLMEVKDLFEVPFTTDVKTGYTYGRLEKLIW